MFVLQLAMIKQSKLVVIVGPTSSGKSDLAVRLSEKFNGEAVSADSRQVYRGMDIGTGKITKKETRGIPHYLLDVASPKKRFTVSQYRKLALGVIERIQKKNKVPFLVGGTGFYIRAVVDGMVIPEVPPDWKLREKLEKQPAEELFKMLKKLDPRRAKNIDSRNKRRLIRALEIITKTKKPVPVFKTRPLPYPVLIIGIKQKKEELNRLIKKRLLKRLKKGLVAEVKRLKKLPLSWKRLEGFGLEYRYVARYLRGELAYKEMIGQLNKEIEHYAKRQMTWFKKDERIKWIENYRQAEKLTKEFLRK